MVSILNLFRTKQKLPRVDRETFSRKFEHYQKLLLKNRQALELMAELKQKLDGSYLFDRRYLTIVSAQIEQHVRAIIHHLNALSDNRYEALTGVLEAIVTSMQEELHPCPELQDFPPTLSLREIRKHQARAAGNKFAHLGELRNTLGIPIPSGFVITTAAFRLFMEENNLRARINQAMEKITIKTLGELQEASRQIQSLIMASPLPPKLAEAINGAYENLAQEEGRRTLVAIRSSAVKEDSVSASFAGQYRSYLNIAEEEVGTYYQKVVASAFSPRALYYLMSRGFDYQELPMAVGVMTMVPAAAAGVVYTRPPARPDKDCVAIYAVFGFGLGAVSGEMTPDVYEVSRHIPEKIVSRTCGNQGIMVVSGEGGRPMRCPVPPEKQGRPVLADDHVTRLAALALKVEKQFEIPQDIEWAMDTKGDLFLVQSRPLTIREVCSASGVPGGDAIDKGIPVLARASAIASAGISAGPVYQVRSQDDLHDFPDGAVLVSHHAPPDYSVIMSRAKAIVTEVGSPASHMATVARELMIPALFNVPRATEILKTGCEITVDAINGCIYAGVVQELIDACARAPEPSTTKTAIYQALKNLAQAITPLHLTDPRATTFAPDQCQTMHDITRFCHEMAMHEMFTLGERSSFPEGSAKSLTTPLPLEIQVIDLQNGITSEKVRAAEIFPNDITCRPFQAFWKGMSAVTWVGPRPVSMDEVMSAGPAAGGTLSSTTLYRNYVIVTDRYMNFSTRLGYHFSSIDAFLGDNIDDNYVQFIFNGGGADLARRVRRATLITRILGHHGLVTIQKEDSIYARAEHLAAETIEQMLMVLGVIVVTTRQMDMVMLNDKVVDWYFNEFIKGRYSFGASGRS